MSKRWMKGLGTGLHELGSTMQARDASAQAMAFKERSAAIAHKRAQDLEGLRHKYRTENTRLSDTLARGRDETSRAHDKDMVGVRTDAQKDVAGHTDSLTRGRTQWERGLDAGRYVDEDLPGGGIIQRDTLSGKASVLQSPERGQIVYGEGDVAHRVQGDRATPIMTEGPGGVVPGDLGPPGGEGGSSVGGTAMRPFVAPPRSASTSDPAQFRLAQKLVEAGIHPDLNAAWADVTRSKQNPAQLRKWAEEIVANRIESGVIPFETGSDPTAYKAAVDAVHAELTGQAPAAAAAGAPTHRYVPGQGLVPVR
jgi:hypothetical protein